MLWTSTSLSLKTSFPALIFFQKINFLRPVFSWGSARRWLHSQAVKLAPYNRLIKRLLIAEIWMMEAEDMDPLVLIFHSVLCSRGRIAHSKWKRSRIHGFLKKTNPDWCYILRTDLVELLSILLSTRQDYNLVWATALMDADLRLNGLCFYNFPSIWCPSMRKIEYRDWHAAGSRSESAAPLKASSHW